MKTFDVTTMRHLDQIAIEEKGITAEKLMERAGNGAAQIILQFIKKYDSSHIRRFVIVTGSGNNGGDGFVIARYLAENTANEVIIFSASPLNEIKSPTSFFHAKLTPQSVMIKPLRELFLKDGDVVIDCLLGTGFNGELKELFKTTIEQINSFGVPIIAIDIPSGLNGDTGVVASSSIKADLTVTIGYPKIGFFKNDGPSFCGTLRCVDIGIETYNTTSLLDTIFLSDAKKYFKKEKYNSHKKTRGSVLVIGGSALYGGAPILSSLSALRAGCGMSRVITANQRFVNYPASLIVHFIDNQDGFYDIKIDSIRRLIDESNSVVVGPGLSEDWRNNDFLTNLLNVEKPIVIDAGALNIISNNRHIYQCNGIRIMTPHPGEMKRLLKGFGLDKYIGMERHLQALNLAKTTKSFVVLKGFQTIVASPDGRYRVNTSGNINLATAGSGDCLAGIIASYINKIDDCFDAISAAVFIHGLAGELSENGTGTISDDLPSLIPKAIKMISANG